MIEISCFYIHYNRVPVNFTFIKYEKFMKIIFQTKKIVIPIEKLKNNQLLFQFYILSLLCTEDPSKVSRVRNGYGVSTEKFWKYIEFYRDYDVITLEKDRMKNPLSSQEPKRETSVKKQNKFLKLLETYERRRFFSHPMFYIDNYQSELLERTKAAEIIQKELVV